VLLWSVAEGGRGRRWRASTRDAEGRLLDDLLLEVERGGRIGRLELTTAAGQLTFHADPDEREAHGNIVTPAGIRHVALRWAPGREVEIPWSPIADAVLAGGPDAAGQRVVARIDADLVPTLATVAVEWVADGRWRVGGREISLAETGVPLFPNGEEWPLEDLGVMPA
jgi:hypothetical protein